MKNHCWSTDFLCCNSDMDDFEIFTATAIFGLYLSGVGLFFTSLLPMKVSGCRTGVGFMAGEGFMTHSMKIRMTLVFPPSLSYFFIHCLTS